MATFCFISGKRCSGKDTLSKRLKDVFLDKCLIDSFSNQVKREVSIKYNLDYDKLINDYIYKNKHRQIIPKNTRYYMEKMYGQKH